MNDTEAMSYLAEIIDAARAGGAPREHIQALQMAREALGEEIEFTCFVGDPHRVKTCPYVDRLEDLETENEELRQSKEELRRNFANVVRDLREAINIAETGVSRGGTNNA